MSTTKYLLRLLQVLGWRAPRPQRVAAVLILSGVVVWGGASVYQDREQAERRAAADAVAAHAQQVSGLLTQVEGEYEASVAPIEQVLLNYRKDDPRLVRQIAVSLVREARRAQLEPRLLLAVLLVENPWLEPGISSPVGAQGLMQVMPFWRGKWKACAPRLDDVEANICHGARIFAMYLKSENGNVDQALLRYNGCVRGTNTPNCHQYPQHVYARAGRASLLAYRPSQGTLGASR